MLKGLSDAHSAVNYEAIAMLHETVGLRCLALDVMIQTDSLVCSTYELVVHHT